MGHSTFCTAHTVDKPSVTAKVLKSIKIRYLAKDEIYSRSYSIVMFVSLIFSKTTSQKTRSLLIT